VSEVEKTLQDNGFARTNRANPKNQRWKHADGSEVQVHAYGNTNKNPFKSGNNAHVHKSIGKHGEAGTTELNDDGLPAANQAEKHIGISNPKDFPAVSGRKHGE